MFIFIETDDLAKFGDAKLEPGDVVEDSLEKKKECVTSCETLALS